MSPAVDAQNRRSRFLRTRRSASLRLSGRDVEVLLALARYRYLPSDQLHALVGGNATTLRWRLRELFDAGLIERPPAQWDVADALNRPAVYALGTLGLRRLEELGLITSGGDRAGVARPGHYWHTLLVSQFMASFEIGARARGLRLISEGEILERLAQARNSHLNPRAFAVSSGFIVPDGLFGLRTAAGVTLYALEADRGHEPLSRNRAGSAYGEKFMRYRELIAGDAYKLQLSTPAPLLVLHVTATSARVRAMMKLAASDPFHLFRALPGKLALNAICPPDISFSAPWTRPDDVQVTLGGGSS